MKIVASPLLSSLGGVTACFTTRHGGVSRPPYTSANLAFHVGDAAADVLANHDLLARTLGYERSRLVYMRQIHSDRIVRVDETVNFDTPSECDALITDRPETALMVMSADCTPILLYDPLSRAIGAVHAGRAGAFLGILPKTIRAMEAAFATAPENLRISFGPSIGGCCYEINTQIAAEAEALGYRNALRFEEKRVFLDVNTILLTQLNEMGISEERVDVVRACTACRSDTYFSYRADAQKTGRIAGVIMLR
ncbi:MAG: peptidoglycan editing factor PgeF [Campylobacterales bacterium]|nr:peptidoglycan editing factor PgeF [Campylobacterales bacterium]